MVVSQTGIFASTQQVRYKAGAGANTTAVSTTYSNNFLFQAESFINAATRYNFSDNYSSLNTDTKGVLQDTATNLAAIYSIQYDMSGYNSRIDAEDSINVLRDAALRNITLLKDKKVTDFIREVA